MRGADLSPSCRLGLYISILIIFTFSFGFVGVLLNAKLEKLEAKLDAHAKNVYYQLDRHQADTKEIKEYLWP